MANKTVEKFEGEKNTIRSKLVIIESLVFFIPGLVFGYLYFEKQISFDTNQFLILLAVLGLILGGLLIIRGVFDRILMVQTLVKRAGEGEQYLLDVQKDTGELYEITKSFNNLMKNFQEANIELKRRVEEIDERKQVEAALKQAKEEAEDANMAKSRFLANMSHEFLTPLNAVIGFSQILLTKSHGELNEKQVKYLNNVLESGQHLLKMINNILELSKIETDGMELELSEFNPDEELRDTVSKIQRTAEKKEIIVSLDIEPDLPDITADRDKFKQIVLNLLNNAVKFTPDGGEIRVNANRASSSQFQLSGSEDPVTQSQLSDADMDFLQISVTDTGVGINPEDQERVFSLFEQADASTERLFDGTGIGLATSRKFVELHEGKLWVESEGEGKGSRFSFALPLNT